MKTFVALLRGINVGGNKKISMQELKNLFEKLHCTEVKTILNSGNVIFKSKESKQELKMKIEARIEKQFGFNVSTQVINFEQIQNARQQNPFKAIHPEKGIQWYVTFLDGPNKGEKLSDKNQAFKVIDQMNDMLFTLVDTQQASSVDFMNLLDKTFGKQVTTRTWKTLERIGACKEID